MIKAAIAIFCASIAAIALFYGHSVIALICLGLAFAMLLVASARTSRRRRDGSNGNSNSNSIDSTIWFASSAHSSGYNDRADCDDSRGSDNAGDCGSDAGDGGGGGSGSGD